MTQQTTHPMAEAPAVELPVTDLEQVVAGKDGEYWWGSVTSGRKAMEKQLRLNPVEIDSEGHIK
jgi:hypothetical protein